MTRMKAKDLMQKDVAYVQPNLGLYELAQFLSDEGIHGAPVVDGSGTVVGVVSRSDVTRAISEEGGFSALSPEFHTVDEEGEMVDMPTDLPREELPGSDLTVSQFMSKNPLLADEEMSAGELARKMLAEGTHRIIITKDGKVTGIVTATDLLKAVVAYEPES